MALDDKIKQLIVSRFVSEILHLSSEPCTILEAWVPVGESSGSLGSLYKCHLSVTRNAEPETHSFIAKFELPRSNPLHEFSVSHNLFDREVAFYEYVSTSSLELRVPAFYFASSSPLAKYLVIEDLASTACTSRFEDGCSYEQCVAVITELAKLHSLTVVSLPPGSALMVGTDNETLQNLYQSGIQSLLQCAAGKSPLLPQQWEILVHQLPEALKAACEDVRSVPISHLHITHGDMWSGNVLFSLSLDSVAALIDWQFAGLEHCPIVDLITFLSSSTDTKIRHQHLTTLLTVYLDSRSDLCKGDLEYCWTKQIFNRHFLTIGTAFAIASWEIFRFRKGSHTTDTDVETKLLDHFWDLLSDYCNSRCFH